MINPRLFPLQRLFRQASAGFPQPYKAQPADSDAPYLQVEQLVKRFGSFTALHGIDLNINQGELLCFLGPSGCGKSTLLRTIAGLERQDGGRILQAGRDISQLSPARRDSGIVFQSYALFPNLTVAQNISYGLKGMAREQARQRVEQLLDTVGLPGSADKYPAALSGGQQQRVALARALALSPGLLLLDEPLSALDATVRTSLRGELKALQKRLGVTTIMVTHDQEEALSMADRIVVMNQGRIEQVGTADQIYLQPASPFVAGFIGKANRLRAYRNGSGQLFLGQQPLPNNCNRYFPAGRDMDVWLRPESGCLLDAPPSGECYYQTSARYGLHCSARVLRLEFMGAHCMLHLEVPRLSESPLQLQISLSEQARLQLSEGTQVGCAFDLERCIVFARSAITGQAAV